MPCFSCEALRYAAVMPETELDRNVWRLGEGSKINTFQHIVSVS